MKNETCGCLLCDAGIPVKRSPPDGRQWVDGWIGERKVYFTLPTIAIEQIKELVKNRAVA